jgi:hypothetical protein
MKTNHPHNKHFSIFLAEATRQAQDDFGRHFLIQLSHQIQSDLIHPTFSDYKYLNVEFWENDREGS